MGKTYSIYLDKEDAERVDVLIKSGVRKADAVKRVLYDRDKMLHKDHEDIIMILENIRSSPILQVGSEKPMVTVAAPATEKNRRIGLLKRLKQKLKGANNG